MQNPTPLLGFLVAFTAGISITVAGGPPAADPAATTVEPAFLGRYSEMLEAGFTGSGTKVDVARRHYEAARRARPDDPRVEYGYALVLLKNFQQEDALDHLQDAIETDGAYLPAWRVQFRESLRMRDYDDLFNQLLTLSDVVGVISENPPPDATRNEISEWLGRAIAFLEGPLGNYEVAEQAIRVTQHLRARLGEELLPGFETGRAALSRQHLLLQSHQAAAMVTAQSERDAELQEAQTAREDLSDAREELEMSKDQWNAWIREQVGDLDSRLGALERQYGQVREQQREINNAMLQIRLEVQRILVLSEQAANGQTPIRVNSNNLEAQLVARQAELDRYLAEYNALESERTQILGAAGNLFGERDASIARYQQATGEAAQRLRQINRWDRRLEQEADEAERSDLQTAQPVRSLRHRIQNWSTYEPFDLNSEPERLLAEYQVQAP